MLDDKTKAMAEGLLIAMQAEHEGHHFYLMAARTTENPQGRETFEQLAQEELEHFNFLQSQYRSVRATGKGDTSLRLGPRADLSGRSPIFSKEIRLRLGEAHFEMTALSVGIQLELMAMKFYARATAEASDPVVKAFYAELAEWESDHYQTLLVQQEELKEEYWAENRFSPF